MVYENRRSMRRATLVAVLIGIMVVLSAVAAYAAVRPAFSADRGFFAGPGPVGITDGDFDATPGTDLVTSNRFGDGVNGNGDISCLSGNGDGTFDAPVQQDAIVSAFSINSANLDEDANRDLVVTDPDSGPATVRVFSGNGDCTFDLTDTIRTGGPGGFEPFDTALADLDTDGDTDVAVTNQEAGSVRIYDNDGTGNLSTVRTVNIGAASNPTGIDAGNTDGDTDTDLAVALSGTGEVTILENERGGNFFDRGATFAMSNADTDPVAIEFGRFNTDDALDIATGNVDASPDNDFVGVAFGRGNGNFDAPRFYSSGGDSPVALTLGNIDGQTRTDITAVNQFSNADPAANAGNVGVLTNNGDGTFLGPDAFDVGDGPNDVTAGRFDADTRIDLATANFGDDDPRPRAVDTVSVLRNRTPAQ